MSQDSTDISPARWHQIDQLLDALLDCPPDQQAALLDRLCAGDELLHQQVQGLLAAQQQAGSFIETPPPQAAELLTPPAADLRGQRLGRYQIRSLLGQGGMGEIYLAEDTQLHQRRVVIKVLRTERAAAINDTWFQKKFAQEIEALVRIDHPGIVGVLDAGTLPDGRLFFVMQFIEGVTLRQLMQSGAMAFARVARLVRQIGQALSAAHDKGVVHRDLKPENIMVQRLGEEEGIAKLIDFGIATIRDSQGPARIESTMVAGTLPYMAPEQFRGHPVAASDIWALGVIAYEMLTGRLPFEGTTLVHQSDLQRAGVSIPPRVLRPDLPASAQAVILKALAYEPTERYERARDFGEALAQALSEALPTVVDSTIRPPEAEKTHVQEAAATTPALTPEMAHILFMDLVGYSKLPTTEQVARQQTLHKAVQQTKEFQRAQQQHQLISLPTGDGMALVFFRDPVAPVQCAVELAQALRSQPEIALRMGVHSGLVYRVADINANRNVAGGGINIAQRVMDCGDAGHILVSSTVAGVLAEEGHWQEYLTDWGEQEVKHGARVHLFNLYTGAVGRKERPEKLQTVAVSQATVPMPIKTDAVRPMQFPIKVLAASFLLLVVIGILWWMWPRAERNITPPPVLPQTRLSYSLRTRPNPGKYPNAKEESLPGEIIFTPGDELRLTFVGAQDGYFYLLNEGPPPAQGLPRYNLLFPPLAAENAPTLRAQQPLYLPQEKPPWFRVDAEQGTETMWLIWSAQKLPEMESLRRWLNAKDGGEIKDAADIQRMQEFLRQHYPAAKPSAEKDEQQTNLKGGKDDLLIYAMKLSHR